MPRVAGVDPGTISFDLCVLDDGAPVVERTFASADLDPGELIAALEEHGPYDLIYGPSGYGLPLVRAMRSGSASWRRWCSSGAASRAACAGCGGCCGRSWRADCRSCSGRA